MSRIEYDEEAFLKELLGIPSVNGADSERNIAVFIRDYLVSCGLAASLQEIDSRHANVVAVLEGETQETVVWNGHLDTVPYGKREEWDTDPSAPVKKDGRYYARGASDMKAGLAGLVWTLGNMKRQGHVPRQTIYFCATCDEEKGGLGARYLLTSKFLERRPSLLLIGEPTGCMPGIVQKGCIWLKFILHGRTSHGAYPQNGVNAMEYGIDIFQRLKERIQKYTNDILGHSTAQISMAKGGIAPNMTPDEAEFVVDIRTVPGLTIEMILEWCGELIETCQKKTEGILRVKMRVENSRRVVAIEEDNEWLHRLEAELQQEGIEPKRTGIHFFTDASVLTEDMPQLPVLLFGPGEASMAHRPNEYVELKKYFTFISILNKLF